MMSAMRAVLSLAFCAAALAAGRPEIPLWSNGAPGSEGKTAKEVAEPPNAAHGYFKITSVHNPSLTVFLPPADRATGAAVVIAPGGGHGDMPPTFLLCADNDRGPSNALAALYPMLKAAGIQTEVHVYATGGHGFGLNPNTGNPAPVASSWHLRLGEWLTALYRK
jgi:acetyl esterase/lipase